MWRAYALAPPTPVRLIHGRGGEFFACSLTWRAYAIRPYSFWQNGLGTSKNCGRYFSTERIDTSSFRYFLPAKIFTSSYRYFLVLQTEMVRRTGTFWCCKPKRLVVPVLFGVANRNGSSYRYFLVLQTETARRTGTFWCCKLKRLVVLVLFDEYFYNVKTYRYFLMCEKTYFYRY